MLPGVLDLYVHDYMHMCLCKLFCKKTKKNMHPVMYVEVLLLFIIQHKICPRCHIISQFNQGFYDYIIATDEQGLDNPTAESQSAESAGKKKKKKKKSKTYVFSSSSR